MDRVALIARLKPGAEPRAAELLRQGPPFEPAAQGFDRHAVYLSAGEVVFVFEGAEVEVMVDAIVSEPVGEVAAALGSWRELVDGPPRIAREVFSWQRERG